MSYDDGIQSNTYDTRASMGNQLAFCEFKNPRLSQKVNCTDVIREAKFLNRRQN